MDELDDVLQELRDRGALDSRGEFTLDWRHALERLRGFQLPDRCFYVLKWIQSAVAARATRCQVRASARALSLTHNGSPFQPDQLQNFFSCLLEGSSLPGDVRTLSDFLREPFVWVPRMTRKVAKRYGEVFA